MALNPLNHYSITAAPSVYDEEAMTALELAGRTAAKVNESVEAFNELEEHTTERLAAQDAAIPVKVAETVQEHIDGGTFDAQIDESLGNLELRMDNMLGSMTTGSTTMDAEIIDARLGEDDVRYTNLGSAIRSQVAKTYKYRGDLFKLGFTSFAQCLEQGYYSIHRTNLETVTDKPAGLVSTCIIEVKQATNTSSNTYPTMWLQIVRDIDGHEWQRFVGANVGEWVAVLTNEKDTFKYRGEISELGITKMSDCRASGFYSMFRGSLSAITDAPSDLTKSAILMNYVVTNNAVYSGSLVYQTIRDLDNNEWVRYFGVDKNTGNVINLSEFERVQPHTQTVTSSSIYKTNVSIGDVATTEKVYALYDNLVKKYPDYVSSRVLDRDIKCYTFTTGSYNATVGQRVADTTDVKPVVLITSGIHGDERSAVLSTFKFFEDLANYNETLATLRENVTFEVIPVVCPYAFDHNQRLNANGVNINRNFATNWYEDANQTGEEGSHFNSEYETVAVDNLFVEYENLATFQGVTVIFIDHHNSGYVDEVSYLAGDVVNTNVVKLKEKYLKGVTPLKSYFINERACADNLIYSYTGSFPGLATAEANALQYTIRSVTLETSWNQSGKGKHSAETIAIGAEILGNMLISFDIIGV